MAKKTTPKVTPVAKKAATVDTTIKATVARNSPIPKAEPKIVSHDMIAKRAYEIYISGNGGSQDENWARAERELRGL